MQYKRRLLYVVGGRRAAPRVDVAVLFGEHLGQNLFDIDWVVFDPKPATAWRKERWNGAEAYWIGRPPGEGGRNAIKAKFIELAADLRTFWLALQGDYELIQVRDKFVSALLCLIAAKVRGRLYVYWLSYPFPESRVLDALEGRARIPVLSWFAGKLSGWLLYKIIMPRANHIFVQSEQMRQDVAAQGISLNKMTSVPMGVDERLLDLPKHAVEPDTVLYLGTLAQVRRLEVLIEAMVLVLKIRPHAKLIFVGEGDSPHDRAFLESKAQQLGVTHAVEFTGQMPMREALERVARAAVCVSPFYPTFVLRSTSPTKLIEYMAQGKPIIANDHPEQKDVLQSSGSGICVSWSAENFAEAMLSLLGDPSAAAEMGAHGPTWVAENRTYKRIADQIYRKYIEVLGVQTDTQCPHPEHPTND
jgi:glycosyltransferase involved in cell wall biosynthesis